MISLYRTALWRELSAAIDTLERALLACPNALWRQRLWADRSEPPLPPGSTEFWYLTYHSLFWLDAYLSGSMDRFAPPAPFTLDELDPAGVLPARPYTKEELHGYLAHARTKCQATLAMLTDEQALRTCELPWSKGEVVTFFQLLLYTMRHVQEHAAQLHLYLGQHAGDAASNVVA